MPTKDPIKKKQQNQEYYKRKKANILKQQKEYQKSEKGRLRAKLCDLKLKHEVIFHYSNGTIQCNYCGYNDPRALALDHINNDGYKHRKETKNKVYQWCKNNNFPPGFQVLCHNCNWIKRTEKNRDDVSYTLSLTDRF